MRNAVLAAAALTTAAVLLAGSGAHAADGAGVPPGGTICTDRGLTDAGVWAYGHATPYNSPVTWTVRVSDTVDGPEVEMVRRTDWELKTVRVATPGLRYYRACMTNTTARSVTYLLHIGPYGQNTWRKAGPHTAVLGTGGRACGDGLAGWLAPTGRLVGTSDLPVRFSVRVTNGDGDVLGEVPLETTTSIDRVLTPPADVQYEACVTNTSQAVATVSWDVLGP
jgi:hypothetical protein